MFKRIVAFVSSLFGGKSAVVDCVRDESESVPVLSTGWNSVETSVDDPELPEASYPQINSVESAEDDTLIPSDIVLFRVSGGIKVQCYVTDPAIDVTLYTLFTVEHVIDRLNSESGLYIGQYYNHPAIRTMAEQLVIDRLPESCIRLHEGTTIHSN